MKTFTKTVLPILIAVALTIIIGVNSLNAVLAVLEDMLGPSYNPNPNPNPNPGPSDDDKYYVNFWLEPEDSKYGLDELYAKVEINANFMMPDDPYREGLVFDGWYYDKGDWRDRLDINVLWSNPPQHDVDVYARFVKWTDSGDPNPEPQAPAELIFAPYTGTPYYAVVGITDGDMTEVTIPDEYNYKKVVAIAADAFKGRTELRSVYMSDNIEHIEASAFEGCRGLIYVDFSYGLKTIGDRAFWGCQSLSDVFIVNETLVSIGEAAFGNMGVIQRLNLPHHLFEVNNKAFDGTNSVQNATVPPSALYSMPKNGLVQLVVWGPGEITTSFSNIKSLESLTIRGGVTKICDNAFLGCTALENLVLTDGLTSIGKYAFKGCTALFAVDLPDSLTEIGQRAFSGCTGLTSIVIGANVEKVEGHVFENCSALAYIYCRASAKPSGWVATWKNSCNATVVWGYKG